MAPVQLQQLVQLKSSTLMQTVKPRTRTCRSPSPAPYTPPHRWFALVSMACGTAFQCLSGRLGLVTGKDLAAHCGERWPRGAAIFLWIMLELAIVAVDIQVSAGGCLDLQGRSSPAARRTRLLAVQHVA